MVKNPQNNEAGYSEKFDVARLRELAEMALAYEVPNGHYSDLECNVWSVMRDVLYRASKGEFNSERPRSVKRR